MSDVRKDSAVAHPQDAATVLLLTHNIGAIDCGDSEVVPDRVKAQVAEWVNSVADWVEQERSAVPGRDLDVFVLHLQEIGGKKMHAGFNAYVSQAVPQMYRGAAWCSGLLMSQHDDPRGFTALGTVIFLSKRMHAISSLLSIRHRSYIPTMENPVAVSEGQHNLFFGAKFSNADTARKGFLMVSLRVGTRILNFVNVHLYHDADNTVSVQSSPSIYTSRRREAFVEAVTEISPIISSDDALFLFGDFNMRLDAKRVVAFLEEKLQIRAEFTKRSITAPKAFDEYFNSIESHIDELLSFDIEGPSTMEAIAAATGIELAELPRRFPPTYLFASTKENGSPLTPSTAGKRSYQMDRLPAWCDRVWFNPTALVLMRNNQPVGHASYVYSNVGLSGGDHSAVYLRFCTSML